MRRIISVCIFSALSAVLCISALGEPRSSYVQINEDYNRLTSEILIRCVLKPTRANLDYAAYDCNVMHYNPSPVGPVEPGPQPISGLHFDATLVPDSLRDRLDQTPLTDAEKSAPMA